MSISSISSGVGATDPLSQLYAPTAAAASTGVATPTDTDTSSSTSVSSTAKLLKQLQQLSQSNPDEFKKVTADIATQLQAQAQQVGGQQGQALTSLASKFQQASQTGDLSALEPKHHHHHHGSGGSTAAAQASSAYQQTSRQDIGSQINSIISSVLKQDTTTATATAA